MVSLVPAARRPEEARAPLAPSRMNPGPPPHGPPRRAMPDADAEELVVRLEGAAAPSSPDGADDQTARERILIGELAHADASMHSMHIKHAAQIGKMRDALDAEMKEKREMGKQVVTDLEVAQEELDLRDEEIAALRAKIEQR